MFYEEIVSLELNLGVCFNNLLIEVPLWKKITHDFLPRMINVCSKPRFFRNKSFTISGLRHALTVWLDFIEQSCPRVDYPLSIRHKNSRKDIHLRKNFGEVSIMIGIKIFCIKIYSGTAFCRNLRFKISLIAYSPAAMQSRLRLQTEKAQK